MIGGNVARFYDNRTRICTAVASVNAAQSDVSLVESELRSRAVSRIDGYDGYSGVIAVL